MTPFFTIFRRIEPAGAFGMVWLESSRAPFAVSLERTYEDGGGAPKTKTPAGVLHCHRQRYNKGGYDTWEIEVPGHSLILFHKGNKELHSDGCCLLAESFVDLDGSAGGLQPGIGDSAGGFTEFMRFTQALDSFWVEFVNVKGVLQ